MVSCIISLRRTNLFESLYILVLPVLLLFLYQVSPFNNPQGNIDSWLYFSYIHNFDDLIERYGLLYYAVRFGHILPHIFFAKIFGPITGYIIFVYLMYLLAGIPLYFVFRKYYSIHAAVLAYSILVSSVWFARTVLWTYTDATAVPFLIAATSLIFLDSRYRRFSNFTIGALVALAINSNAFSLVIFGISIISYLILYSDRLLTKLKYDLPWIASGMVLIFAAGGIFYYDCCGTIDYYSPTINVINWSNNGGGLQWKVPVEKLPGIGYLYFPPFLILVLSILHYKFRFPQSRLFYAGVFYLLGTVVFYVWYEFSKDAVIMETYFYFSYLLVPSISCLALVPILLSFKIPEEKLILVFSTVTFIVLPLLVSKVVSLTDGVPVQILLAVSILTIVFLMIIKNTVLFVGTFILIFAITYQLFWVTTINGEKYVHAEIYNQYEIGMSRYRLGLKFIDVMPKYINEKKPIYFWYENDDDVAKSLQSTYLWAYSRLMAYEPEVNGLPDLYGVNEELLFQRSSLVLFGQDNNKVQKGIQVLINDGVKIKKQLNHVICEGLICYYIAILDVEGKETASEKLWNQNQLFPLKFNVAWQLNQPGSNTGDAVEINTSSNAWDYAAVGSLDFADQEQGKRGVVRLLLSVSNSEVGIAFFGNDELNFIKRLQVFPSKEPFELFFDFENVFDIKRIIIQSWNKSVSANVKLLDMDIRSY